MQKDPYKAPELFADTNYKIAVLEELLTYGEVNTYKLSRELNEKFGAFDVEAFNSACAVIEDYAKTGGKGVVDGTGLKFEKKSKEKTEPIKNADDKENKKKMLLKNWLRKILKILSKAENQ